MTSPVKLDFSRLLNQYEALSDPTCMHALRDYGLVEILSFIRSTAADSNDKSRLPAEICHC